MFDIAQGKCVWVSAAWDDETGILEYVRWRNRSGPPHQISIPWERLETEVHA